MAFTDLSLYMSKIKSNVFIGTSLGKAKFGLSKGILWIFNFFRLDSAFHFTLSNMDPGILHCYRDFYGTLWNNFFLYWFYLIQIKILHCSWLWFYLNIKTEFIWVSELIFSFYCGSQSCKIVLIANHIYIKKIRK